MGRVKSKHIEIALLTISSLVFLLAFVIYLTDYPIIRSLFATNDGATNKVIGYVVKRSGNVVRQLATQTDFRTIETLAPVYNMDLIVTSNESEALIQFDAGGVVQINPDSMVRLSFAPSLQIGGVVRVASLEVVAGTIYGQAGSQKLLVKAQGQVVAIKQGMKKGMAVGLSDGVKVLDQNSISIADFAPLSDAAFAKLKKETSEDLKVQAKPLAPPRKIVRVTRLPTVNANEVVISPSKIEKAVVMSWSVEPPNETLQMVVRKGESENANSGKPILTQVISVKENYAETRWIGPEPGTYSWEILNAQGLPLEATANTKGTIVIEKAVELKGELSAKVSGSTSLTNALRSAPKKEFAIELQWPRIPGATLYELWLGRDFKRPLLVKKVDSNEFIFNKGKVFSGNLAYKISSQLENGYVAHLPPQQVTFQFLPPQLVVPQNGSKISKVELSSKDENKMLLTWQSTNFTKDYEVEISRDQKFTQTFLKRVTKENYLMVLNPPVGEYWWRVRSRSGNVTSRASLPSHYSVVR